MGIKDKFLYFDQFGVLFQLSVQGEDPQYRSIAGAIASLFINLTCIVYFCYLLSTWLTDKIVPTVASQNNFQDEGKTFKLQESPFYFTVEAYDNDTLHSFQGRKLYDIKTQLFFDGEVYEDEEYNADCKNKFSVYFMDFFDPICTNIKDKHQYKLTQNYKERYLDDYLGYYLYACNPESKWILKFKQNKIEDPLCFTEEEAQFFLTDLNGDARVTSITQEFDLDTKEIKSIPFDYYFPLGYRQRTVVNLFVTVSHLTIERGVIFPTTESYEFVSKIEIKPQTVFREDGEPFVTIWVSLDRKQINVEIVYPKLPEILAQFQSVFSWLMMFGIIFTAINNRNLKKKLLKQIGDMYFSNYSALEKPIKEYNDKEQYKKIHNTKIRIDKNLMSKFNFINIMYEISKIQLAMQTLIKRKDLSEIQNIKYKLVFDEDTINQENQKYQFTQDDFYIMSQFNIKQRNRLIHTKSNRSRLKSKLTQICDLNIEDPNQITFFNQQSEKLFQLESGKQQSQDVAQQNDPKQNQITPLTVEVII